MNRSVSSSVPRNAPRAVPRGWLLSALFVFGIGACLEPTQVTLRLDTDARCTGQAGEGDVIGSIAIFNGVDLTSDDLASPTTVTSDCSEGNGTNTIGSLVIVPGTSSSQLEVTVVATVTRPDGTTLSLDECLERVGSNTLTGQPCIVAKRRLSFIESTPLELPVTLATECIGVQCAEDETCKDSRCVPAEVECSASGCIEPSGAGGAGGAGGAQGVGGGGGAGGGPLSGLKRVFVSSKAYVGAGLGGLNGADAKCNSLAQNAKLPGTYRAWLSTDKQSASSRMNEVGPWHLLNPGGVVGPLVANDLTDLTDGELGHAIDRTESGSVVAPIAEQCSTDAPVHTGTAPDGSFDQASATDPADPKFDCGDWTSGGATDQRLVGDARSATSNWTQVSACLNSGVFCTQRLARLYCFEQ
jgi:hypothetical protein